MSAREKTSLLFAESVVMDVGVNPEVPSLLQKTEGRQDILSYFNDWEQASPTR